VAAGTHEEPRPRRFRVIAAEDGLTLEHFLARRLGQPRGETTRELIRAGGVYVGRHRVRLPQVRVVPGERITVYPSAAALRALRPEDLRIVLRDPDFVILDKPAGIPVDATREGARGSLAEALVMFLESEGVTRPYVGVVHRLDRDASGLVLFTTRGAANASLHRQFVERQIHREYRLLVHGRAPETVRCDVPLREHGGRIEVARHGEPGALDSTTTFRRIATLDAPEGPRSLLEATLGTGRTHQIRVHAHEVGLPLVGDRRYGVTSNLADELHLHAHRLRFTHPVGGATVEAVSSPPRWATATGH
jgi:23S rRNA pseudouridine1911/1915/1917 synthase